MHNPTNYSVTTYHGESATLYYVVWHDPDGPEDDWNIVATYRERWRAENHALVGCGCAQNSHYFGIPDVDCARKEG